MTDTANLGLPLLQPSQAQKHVTVNEALERLDVMAQLTVASRSLTAPPAGSAEGEAHVVPVGAAGDWTGQGGALAVYSNGGWSFIAPREGWRAWCLDEAQMLVCLGGQWHGGMVALSQGGAGTQQRVLEWDQPIDAPDLVTAQLAVPNNAVVLGVTGRVTAQIGGTATSWRAGVTGHDNKFGAGLGLDSGSYLKGLLQYPETFYSGLQLILTPEGGTFAGGSVRLAVHFLEITPPL